MASRVALRLAWILAVAPAATANVIRIVDRPNLGPFTSLQMAVDAALEGELLIVEEGSYNGLVTIEGKSLSIVAMPGSETYVSGGVVVRNLALGQSVFLAGLDIYNQGGVGLSLSKNQGPVRVQDCVVSGGKSGSSGNYIAHAGVSVVDCPRVVLANCEPTGGYLQYLSGLPPVQGGAGVDSTNSSVALFDCFVRGGTGSHETYPGGKGGSGLKINGWGAFLSGTTLRGGGGGAPDYIGCPDGGPGGDALTVINAQVQMLDSPLIPGPGGQALCGNNGPPGSAFTNSGGVLVTLPGDARVLHSELFASDSSPFPVTLTGAPGDKVWLFRSYQPAFSFLPGLGTWTVHRPAFVPLVPLGTVPASGTLTVGVDAPMLAAGSTQDLLFAQALVIDTTGKGFVSSPLHVSVIDSASLPDCNNSQVNDFLEMAQHTVGDCDKNLQVDTCEIASGAKPDCNLNTVPDACDLAAGVEKDCNGNQIPDSCDLASGFSKDCNANLKPDSCDIATGFSKDVNHNGIPDECETHTPVTWWVDDDALPGGNGTQSQPFQTIVSALAVAFHGDTVLLRDGVYKGAGNKNLNPSGREVVLRSESGPPGCVIDLEGSGRAFMIASGEGPGLRFRGLTIRNGNVQGAPNPISGGAFFISDASPVIEFCVIENCTAKAAGGIYASSSGLVLRNTLISGCTATGNTFGVGRGGGLLLGTGFDTSNQVTLVNCIVRDCSAFARGGGVWTDGNWPVLLSHCRIIGNSAPEGGGVASLYTHWNRDRVLLMDNCLVAGNSATTGGALQLDYAASTSLSGSTAWTLTGCTLVQNSASSGGGTIQLKSSEPQMPPLELVDTIVWSTSAPVGPLLVHSSGLADVRVSYCDLQGGASGFVLAPGSNFAYGAGNIQLDPLFLDADGPDNNPLTIGDNDYRLAANSPASDAGSNALVALDLGDIDGDGNVSEPTPLDLLLQPRFVENPVAPNTGQGTPPLVDMGALERQP